MPPPPPVRPTPLPNPPSEASMAGDLAASKAEDTLAEDKRISPLELEPKSYAEVPEYAKQRAKERKMIETGERFVGAPVVHAPTKSSTRPEEGAATREETGRRRAVGAGKTTQEEAAGPHFEAQRAASLQEQRDEDRVAAQRDVAAQSETARSAQRQAVASHLSAKRAKHRLMLRIAAFLAPCCLKASIFIIAILVVIIVVAGAITGVVKIFESIVSWFS